MKMVNSYVSEIMIIYTVQMGTKFDFGETILNPIVNQI